MLQEIEGGKSFTVRDNLGGTAAYDPKTKVFYAASQSGSHELVIAYRAVPKK